METYLAISRIRKQTGFVWCDHFSSLRQYEIANWTCSWRTLQEALNISINLILSTEISKGCVFIPFSIATAKADPTDFLVQPNILISNESPPRACIADFGLCSISPSRSFGPSRTIAGGTFGYMAPELFNEGARASKEGDMYAFGMLVYEVITGARPFEHHRVFALPTLTVQGSRPPRPEDPAAIGFGQGTWDFVERCWNENPKLRPSATEALDHFRRAAKTSTDVDPGPTVPIREPAHPKPESSSINLCECNGPSVSFLTALQPSYFPARLRVARADSNKHPTPRVCWSATVPSLLIPCRPERNLAGWVACFTI